jgi:hypothetical protein
MKNGRARITEVIHGLTRNGFNVQRTPLHRAWFDLLRLSPSYELARRYRQSKGRVSPEDKQRLPKDFDQVLAVFDDLGAVQNTSFRRWWIDHGLRNLGSPGDRPESRLLFVADGSGKVGSKLLNVARHFDTVWIDAGCPPTMVLALPLNVTRQQALREVKQLFEQRMVEPWSPTPPKYSMSRERAHEKNVLDAVRVLWIRTARPDFRLWQVGVAAKISKTYGSQFDISKTKRTANNSEELRTLEMLTSRKYRLGRWLAENAARGLFPLQSEPDHEVAFDPKEFHQILTETVQWERREKAGMLAEAEAVRMLDKGVLRRDTSTNTPGQRGN